MKYKLELDSVIKKIKDENARLVCVQLPDGLKPDANVIADAIEKNTEAKVVMWFGSCYGACDVPMGLDKYGFDLLVQFGHAQFVRPWPASINVESSYH